MLIPEKEGKLFFELYPSVIGFAAGKAGGIDGIIDRASYKRADVGARINARDYLFKNPALLKEYVDENPDGFRESDLALVSSWRHFKAGDFLVERELKAHTIFLGMDDDKLAYGVCGLLTEITDMVPFMPIWITAVLLPWKGRIVCDGMFSFRQITFGGGIRAGFKEQYQEAKAKGIITTFEAEPSAMVTTKGRRSNGIKINSSKREFVSLSRRF